MTEQTAMQLNEDLIRHVVTQVLAEVRRDTAAPVASLGAPRGFSLRPGGGRRRPHGL